MLATIILGLLIDVWSFLFSGLSNASYTTQIICIILGSVLLAIVRYIQVNNQYFVIATDALTQALNDRSIRYQNNALQIQDFAGIVLGALLAYWLIPTTVIGFARFFTFALGIGTLLPLFLVPYMASIIQLIIGKLEDSDMF